MVSQRAGVLRCTRKTAPGHGWRAAVLIDFDDERVCGLAGRAAVLCLHLIYNRRGIPSDQVRLESFVLEECHVFGLL